MSQTKPITQPSRGCRVLLVDDDRLMLSVVGDMLRDLGVGEIVTGATGTEAAHAFDRMRPPPEVVVCDLNMPGGDGFQFMEQLGSRGYAGGVVVMSGLEQRVRNSAELMGRFHGLKVVATLSKPVDAPALRSAISSFL